MRHPIAFQPSSPNLISALTPSIHQPYEDLILRPEYADRKYTLPKGASTFRLLPALQGSDTWMATIYAHEHGNGRHLDPKTIQSSRTSVYDIARDWLQQHQPDSLYRKDNPGGHKLWSTRLTATWILVEGPEPPELRILIASDFAGSTRSSASPGLAHRIKEQVQQTPDLLNPDAAYQLKLVRSYKEGRKYPETQISTRQNQVPLNELLAQLSADDLAVVRPITETIRQIDVEEEWTLLAKVIGTEIAEKIRMDTDKN